MRLEEFHVSEKFGFMLPDPRHTLPDYFEPWNHLAANLLILIQEKNVRTQVHQMPLLDPAKLEGYRQKRLAHLQLTVISTGYIWQDGEKGMPDTLPKCLAVPWYTISEDIGIVPVVCHPDMVLCNWKLADPQKPASLEDLRCTYNLPGGMDANWFFMIPARMELDFAPAIKCIVDSIEATDNNDTETLIPNLQTIRQVITQMKNTFKNIHGLISPDIFYNTFRPFLRGFGGEGSPHPEGIIFEGISDKPIQMTGGSAAQSSTLQCLDAAFSVKPEPKIQNFLVKMRDHMPKVHKEFIETIAEKSNIRNYVMKSEDEKLKEIFNDVLLAMVDFRSYHIQIVAKYILIPSSRQKRDNLLSKRGTGGTNMLPFLKSIRKATSDKLVEEEH